MDTISGICERLSYLPAGTRPSYHIKHLPWLQLLFSWTRSIYTIHNVFKNHNGREAPNATTVCHDQLSHTFKFSFKQHIPRESSRRGLLWPSIRWSTLMSRGGRVMTRNPGKQTKKIESAKDEFRTGAALLSYEVRARSNPITEGEKITWRMDHILRRNISLLDY